MAQEQLDCVCRALSVTTTSTTALQSLGAGTVPRQSPHHPALPVQLPPPLVGRLTDGTLAAVPHCLLCASSWIRFEEPILFLRTLQKLPVEHTVLETQALSPQTGALHFYFQPLCPVLRCNNGAKELKCLASVANMSLVLAKRCLWRLLFYSHAGQYVLAGI